jgi:molybdate transport system substrate-binding protein
MKCAFHIKILALICAAFTAQSGRAQAETTVFAAASLRGALDEIAALSTTKTTLSYAGSGVLARQVSQGAPADVIILAHPRWMDWLESQGSILPDTRADVASNALVVIGQKGAASISDSTQIPDRLGQGRLAMGQRDAVPAGIYAREWLQSAALWDQLKPKLAEVENVRLALSLVARNEAPLGVVYRSDAHAEPKVDVLFSIPETAHDPIKYPAAAITEKGRGFIDLLTSAQASLIFQSHGFTAPKVTQ